MALKYFFITLLTTLSVSGVACSVLTDSDHPEPTKACSLDEPAKFAEIVYAYRDNHITDKKAPLIEKAMFEDFNSHVSIYAKADASDAKIALLTNTSIESCFPQFKTVYDNGGIIIWAHPDKTTVDEFLQKHSKMMGRLVKPLIWNTDTVCDALVLYKVGDDSRGKSSSYVMTSLYDNKQCAGMDMDEMVEGIVHQVNYKFKH